MPKLDLDTPAGRLRWLVGATATDNSRPVLQYVSVDAHGTACAADGFRMRLAHDYAAHGEPRLMHRSQLTGKAERIEWIQNGGDSTLHFPDYSRVVPDGKQESGFMLTSGALGLIRECCAATIAARRAGGPGAKGVAPIVRLESDGERLTVRAHLGSLEIAPRELLRDVSPFRIALSAELLKDALDGVRGALAFRVFGTSSPIRIEHTARDFELIMPIFVQWGTR